MTKRTKQLTCWGWPEGYIAPDPTKDNRFFGTDNSLRGRQAEVVEFECLKHTFAVLKGILRGVATNI